MISNITTDYDKYHKGVDRLVRVREVAVYLCQEIIVRSCYVYTRDSSDPPAAHVPDAIALDDRRTTIRIDEEAGLPTYDAIQRNAIQLAQYAAVSQAAGLVPIVEPEILIEGTHSPELFAEVFIIRY